MASFRISFLVVLATMLMHHVTSDTCQPIKEINGLNYLNCSGKGLSGVELKVDNLAEMLDYSNNKFWELPKLIESSLCDRTSSDCHVVNNTENHCRYDVSFSRNEIRMFHTKALSDLHCLRTLDLSYNDITSSVLSVEVFRTGTYHLENLILRGNPLGNFPSNVITSPFSRHIRFIDLSNCQLSEIEVNSVDDHSELTTLNLSHNNLTNFDNATFKGLKNLRVLDLSYNQLTSFGHQLFADLTNLDILLLDHNHIQAFARHAFYMDSRLRSLDLSYNSLETVPYQALQELSEMRHLILSYNPVRSVTNPDSSIVLSGVQTLEMEGMASMTSMDNGALASFPSLVTLSIRRNRNLKSIHPDFLGPKTPFLREVRLDFNGLTTLAEDALPFDQLKRLSLKGNPWMCDYRLRWMISSKAILPNTVICDGPVQLRGRDIKTIQPVRLQRPFTVAYAGAIILCAVLLPTIGSLTYFLCKRRRELPTHSLCCLKCKRVHGRYMSVYTRDVDSENEDRVDIQVKIGHRRLKAVSNGGADDTQPFVTMESLPATEHHVDVTDDKDV